MKPCLISILMLTLACLSGCRPKSDTVELSSSQTSGAGGQGERDGISVIGSLPVGAVFKLCDQQLTSRPAIEASFRGASEKDSHTYFDEGTAAIDAFYYPAKDIAGDGLTRRAQLLFNAVALANRIAHAYELFQRETTSADDDTLSRRDTLAIISRTQPVLPQKALEAAFPDAQLLSEALKFRDAYARFDGDDNADSPFSQAYDRFMEKVFALPPMASEERIERFEKEFWPWYDKRQFVPEIDAVIRLAMSESKADSLSDEALDHFRAAVLSERNINRRAILALEYAKYDHWNGAELLGEILESKQYTRYLLECWIAWRAYVQDTHSVSSFGVIPDNYYDKIRAVCADTFIRHILEREDGEASCLLQNLVLCEVLHRQACLYGNESFLTCMNLCSDEFIDPRLLN